MKNITNRSIAAGRRTPVARFASRGVAWAALCCLPGLAASAIASPAGIGPGDVVVHTALGGFILGYDIDQTGNLGLLAEALSLPGGGHNVAVETFDQRTGEILDVVVQQTDSLNDFVVLGIYGKHTGLVEFEHVSHLFVDKRVYGIVNPVRAHRFTGRWTPPLAENEIIQAMAVSQGAPLTAVLAFTNGGSFRTFLFSANVAANTFGPTIELTDPGFSINNSPVIAIDNTANRAVLGSSNGCPNCSPEIGIVDLAVGTFTKFRGLGLGYINGIAVDSTDGIACTTTEIDFSVEFYDLETHAGKKVRLPGAVSQAQSGGDVQFDSLNKLFLVGQTMSSTAPTGSSIQVFDTEGNFVESLNGFRLPASPTLIALNPGKRTGFVLVTPDLTSLQSFSY